MEIIISEKVALTKESREVEGPEAKATEVLVTTEIAQLEKHRVTVKLIMVRKGMTDSLIKDQMTMIINLRNKIIQMRDIGTKVLKISEHRILEKVIINNKTKKKTSNGTRILPKRNSSLEES